jgi:hypothetical protein
MVKQKCSVMFRQIKQLSCLQTKKYLFQEIYQNVNTLVNRGVVDIQSNEKVISVLNFGNEEVKK